LQVNGVSREIDLIELIESIGETAALELRRLIGIAPLPLILL
jgi:hypothetical protein